MAVIATLALSLSVLTVQSPPVPEPQATPSAAEQEALIDGTIAAEEWLKSVDADRFGESWRLSSALMHASVDESDWAERMAQVRERLGGLVERRPRARKYMTQVPNGPAGRFVLVQYDSRYERAEAVRETVSVLLDIDGAWRVTAYNVK